MKKLLLAGSSLVALALFVLGGIEVPNQNAAVATNPAEVVSTRTLGATAKNSEQIPDTTPLETGEVLGAQSVAPAQSLSLSASQTSGARSGSDVFNNVVESSNDSREAAYANSSSRNSNVLKSASSADLSVSAPTTVRSFGPNGTHWPTRTPFMYDESVASIEVEANWQAIETAIGNVTKAQADAGFRILVKPGTLVGQGKNPSSGGEAVANVGSADWNKRVVVAPRDGFGTVTWIGGTRIHKVFNVAFAGFIIEGGLKATGNSESAFAWTLSRDGQHGFYGTSGQTTTDMEIVEFVVPDSQGVSDDTADIYSGGGTLTNVKVIGSYLAPRFWLYKDCGTDCPHTDTLQYAKGSGGSYSDMYIIDSALFASNNATVQTGNIDKLVIDHSYLIGGESSRRRYNWLPGASSEGYQQVFNGSGKNFEAYDSIIIGTMGINSTDAQYPWKHVSNTKTNSVSARYVPATGAWTVDPTLTSWGATQHDLYAPRPTESSLLAMWGKNNSPRTSAPSFSPAEETHNTSVSVSLTSPTAGASIYYTTNGSNPTTASTRYTGPFTLSSTATVKAIATSAGIDNSFVQSKTYTIIVPGAPTITTQPLSTSAAIGGVATFTVQATANPAVSGYQWKKNGTNIAGATSASYTTPLLSAADSGSIYTVAVTNSSGTTLSNGATLTVAQLTSSTSFQNYSVGTKTGTFTASFDVSPAANGTDMATGLSGSAATSYGSMSAIVRMKDGKFDVHSTSGTYTADTIVPYVAGQTYRVEIDANVDTDRYSVRVNGITIATNRTFRTAVSSITHLTYVAASGPHSIGNITFGNGGGTNQTPVVNVGTDKIITLPTNSVTLDATATDDGAITTTWTEVSGAGTVTFGSETSIDTTATFSAAGSYVLRLTANDGDLSAFDELTVIVNSPTGVNQAPVVSAGSDRAITLPANSVALDATVTDDGLPAGSTVSSSWTEVSGAGTVTFANANAVDTTATFSAVGTYVLRLTSTDGTLFATDEVTVIVNQGGGTGTVTVSGELKKWHKVTLSMEGPTTSESATPNPFRDYKADVTFTHTSGRTYTVPAYFAADGNAGESDVNSSTHGTGNIWRAHFAPDLTGTWTYVASFREGSNIAISTSASAGTSAGYFNGATDTFSITDTDKSGKDLRGKGRLVYDGEHYLKFSETGERFIKAGVDSPENLLAYNDFDNTPDIGNGTVKTWSAHAGDYVTGDPSWKGGKGTEIIGAVNYLSNQGLNAFSFLTYNVGGDDGNVYPFTSAGDEVRFDTSKLDQWGEVFDHATKKGMYLHFKMMETENDEVQTNDEFKLYARELVARYGHNLALNWNLGEENGRAVTDLKIWATYLKDVDAYDHNRVLHLTCGTWPGCNSKYFGLMGNASDLTGFSMQGTDSSNFENTFAHVKTYVDESASQGKKWVIGMDEPGDSSTGVHPDSTSGNNHAIVRKHALWGTIMAGGQGVEWYYGGSNQGDITLTDFRSRNNFYTYNKYAIDFLTSNGLPVAGLTNQNSLISGNSATGNKVLAQTNQVYLVQLINGGNATLNLSAASGSFDVKWLNPRTGAVTTGTSVSGGGSATLSSPDSNDWIVLVKKGTTPPPPSTAVFNSAGGVVVIETENTSSNLGSGAEFWALRTSGNAAYVANATNNAHLEYRSTDVNDLFIDDTPGDVPLEYTFKINDGGLYQLHIRSHKNIEDATRPDLNNDAFVKMAGVNGSTFTAGPNAGGTHLNDAPLSMLQSYTKIAGGSSSAWAWADQLDAGGDANKRWPVYNFQTGGTYTLTMSGRSRGYAPDRIVLRRVSTIPMPLAKNYDIPQSSKIDGGTNPNITPITFGSTQVRTTELVNVRPGASLTSGLVGQMPFGSIGTIIGGPTVSSDNITWWQVNFAGATDGWTGQDNIEVIPGTGGGTNQAPVVNAGADVSVTLPTATATLAGTATDSDGTIASRVWTKVSGPAASLSGQTTNTLSLSGLVEGTYVFRLTATDNDGATGFDEASVTVSTAGTPGVLLPLPSSAVQAAIAVPLIEYNKTIPGGAFTLFVSNGGASITLAANSYAGDTTSDARLLEQIRYSIRGDKTIYANGGYPAQHEKHVTGMFTMAKYTPRIWNQITAAEKEKIDAIMTASLIGNAFTTSDTGPSTPRTLDGDTNLNRDWNPNYREGMIGGVLVAIAYFGPDQAQAIMSAYDHTVFTQKLNTLGLTNPAGIFAQASASSVHSAVRNYKYYGRTVQDYMGLYDVLVSDTFGRNVTCASAGGSIDSGCAGIPNLGQPGMLKEFNSVDAGGGRSSIGYAYDGYRPHLTNQLVLIASGLWDQSSATATKTKGKNLVAVGTSDLIYKLEKGYTGFSKGLVEPSENITSPDRGYRYTLPIWNDILRPFHGLPKAPNPDYGTARQICASQCVPGTEIEIFKTNVNVRSVATTVGNTPIGQVQPGDKGTVLEGPVSAGGINWYRVQYSTKALTGWSGSDNMWVSTPSVPDTEDPSNPANLRVSGVTANTVVLNWNVSTDNIGVTGYEVRRDGNVVSNSSTNSFTATGLTIGQTYDFDVRAFDAAGNKSGYSSAVATTTYGFVDTLPPSVPTNLAQTGVTNTSATITWTASTDNVAVTSYEIFRGTTPVGTSAGLSFTDNGLTRDTAYSYTVKAKDAAGNTSAASASLSVRTTDVTSKIPVRVASFGPNGTHWPDKIPTPFMYDETVPSIVINPSWTELKTALQSVTKAQADAGLRILIKDGEMVGNGAVNYSHSLENVGSADWAKRVTVAPLNGYGRVTWTKGVSILNVQGVAFAGFKVEKPGIRFKGNNRSALAWINISGGASTNPIQLLVGASTQLSVADTEVVEVVMRDSQATDSDTFAIQGLSSGSNSIKKVTVAGSYFAPRFVTGSGHTDTIQFATGSYTDQTGSIIQDTAIFGSSNGALQVGSLNGLTLDNTVIMSGNASKSRYPILSGGSGPAELAFNGGSTGMKTYNSIFIGGMGSPDWDVIENTRVGRLPSVSPSPKWILQPNLLNWTDDAAGYANLIPMPTDAYLAQIWAKDSTPVTYRTLTTSVTGSGTVSGTSVPTQQYVDGTSVTLTATPATGGTFLGWGGACASAGGNPTCTVLMNANKSVSAAFLTITAPEFLLTITKTGTGTGTVTGNPVLTNGVSQLYFANTPVVLTATPAAGSTFAGWSGACTGTSATCTVTMTAAKNVTATFNLVTVTQYAFTVNNAGTGAGTVSGATSGQLFPSGTVVTLTATPSAGSTFAGWTGACTGTSATCNVTMSANKTATATFNTVTVTQYTLTVAKSGTGTGTVSGSAASQAYNSGTAVTLTATPNADSTFAGWSGACTGTSATCTVTMSANKTATATFTLIPAGQVATPTFSPSSMTSATPVSVTITTATPGSTIRYTTNGSTPTSSSTLYSGPVSVSSTATIKAIALKSGMTNSAVGDATYTISSGPGGSLTSSTTWAAKTFTELSGTATRNGKFEVRYTATPLSNNIDSLMGLSNGTPSSTSQKFTVFGPIVRFNADGKIDARNGGAYAAASSVSYTANTNYAVRMEIDVPSRTYSAWVNGVQIATNYAFRSEQSTVTQLTHFGYVAVTGAHRMTNVVIENDAASDTTAPTVPTGLTSSSVTQTSAQINWSASTDAVGVTGYEILRNGTVVGNSDTTSYAASGLTAGTSYPFTVRAFDATGNKSAVSSSLNVVTASPITVTSAGTWAAKTFAELSGTATRTGSFEVTYTAKPSRGDADVLTGLSNVVPTTSGQRFTVFGPIVIFDTDGKIKARNGGAYVADTSVSYVANGTYNIKMQVNVATRTYSVWVDGVQIATNYAFRSEQATLSQLSYFGYVAVSGSHTMTNVVIGQQ